MAGDDDTTIKLCITFHQGGISSYVNVDRDKILRDLLVAYCKKKNLEYGQMRFIYGGKRLQAKNTPNQIGMKYGDEIEAFMNVHGGGGGGSR